MNSAMGLGTFIIRVFALTLLGMLSGGCLDSGNPESDIPPRRRLEKQLRDDNRILVQIPYGIPNDASVRGVRFDRNTVRETPLYIRHKSQSDYLLIAEDGAIFRNGEPERHLQGTAKLLFNSAQSWLIADDRLVLADLDDWDIYWITAAGERPDSTDVVYPEVAFTDQFMRTRLEADFCRPVKGTWRLNQHGGGMPASEAESARHNVQRAVNPFSALGKDSGRLEFGASDWFNYRAEASFYFGIPRTGNVIDINTVPTKTMMMIGQGGEGGAGPEASFGWDGDRQAFILRFREDETQEWSELGRYDTNRPPLTNWARIGIEIEAGVSARGYLDGIKVVGAQLPRQVSGPAFILSGEELIGIDDLTAWSLPRHVDSGTPLFVRSRNFADKEEKERSDPPQFAQWARGSDTFLNVRLSDDKSENRGRMIITRLPLMGAFQYESRAFADDAGRLPTGFYELRFYTAPGDATQTPTANPPQFSLAAEYTEDGWKIAVLDGSDDTRNAATQSQFIFSRRGRDAEELYLKKDGTWMPLDVTLKGALHVGIVYWGKTAFLPARPPSPMHHHLTSFNLTNELFEQAPTEWSWIDGAFRMDSRWACADEWNFMACGSTAVPYMTSKQKFHGDQAHEYFISIRPVLPWDAGDTSFRYRPRFDHDNLIFRQNQGWYVRRDLNFSFCTDGVNPLSGYAVVFGGDDNRATRLLRRGEVVAQTRIRKFRFPYDTGRHGDVHWEWWKFTIHRRGSRVQVFINDELMFDYDDPQPIEDGHAGFWSLRNGFSVTKVTHIAEKISRNPQVLYVKPNRSGPENKWQALPTDSSRITRTHSPGMVEVTHNVGAGFFAVRQPFDEPVDLTETPVLELPFLAGSGTAVNLHFAIAGRSYIARLNAPLSGMKSFLTPQYEKGECFRLPTKRLEQVRRNNFLGDVEPANGIITIDLEAALAELGVANSSLMLSMITIGNTSNDDYMLAGGTNMNLAGARFRVGVPRFRSRDE